MKTNNGRVNVIYVITSLAVGFAILTSGCATTKEGDSSSIPVEIPVAIEEDILKRGQAITSQAFGVLSSRLGKAIAEAGLTNAITFCSVHGLPLTSSVGETNSVVLRRVSHKPRNLRNRANDFEMEIIRLYQEQLGDGVTPKPIVSQTSPSVYTYHAPIAIKLPLCLNCHGEPYSNIQSDTLAQIQKLYPADEATGFKMGELRGLWAIDITPPPAD